MSKQEKLTTLLKLINAKFTDTESRTFTFESMEVSLVPKKHNVLVLEFNQTISGVTLSFPEIAITPEHIIFLSNEKDDKEDLYIKTCELLLDRI